MSSFFTPFPTPHPPTHSPIQVPRTVYERDANGTSVDRQTGQRFSKRSERISIEATLQRGMKGGQQIRFEGKGNVIPGMLPGDVVLVVQVRWRLGAGGG